MPNSLLALAVFTDNLQQAKKWIANKADVNSFIRKQVPLLLDIRSKEILKLFCDNHVDLLCRDAVGRNALHLLFLRLPESDDLLNFLLNHEQVNEMLCQKDIPNGNTPLHIMRSDLVSPAWLQVSLQQLSLEVLTARNTAGLTPLMVAVQEGNTSFIKALVFALPPMNMDDTDHNGLTALMQSPTLLLEAGASPRTMSNEGNYCIHVASSPAEFLKMPKFFERGMHLDVVCMSCCEALYAYGADVNSRDSRGRAPGRVYSDQLQQCKRKKEKNFSIARAMQKKRKEKKKV
eukprot:GHVR01015486.1.p1 GENE.GHVR01015486.1~~GHVR01015486.1.p1  ORF type:complete len:290 (+),score=38.29 GHVR01015486.1:331-1200(+)